MEPGVQLGLVTFKLQPEQQEDLGESKPGIGDCWPGQPQAGAKRPVWLECSEQAEGEVGGDTAVSFCRVTNHPKA